MSAFIATVRRLGKPDETFHAIGTDSGAVHLDALERFGICGVTILPA